ncbi:hypothetical protein L6270_01135 [Candidatus Parcubacteria bacterium]|nr:hypothetical protein [Patescibacteria group bacterium]MBU4309749.1 hypothetical protein [Patescibacteria group bacterium]MBU4578088.1 hypothetical protein [Patescibacteria group bacterium]MCG2696626.1 hypothetical protein [Candidatus Parcubacteria bacterium]
MTDDKNFANIERKESIVGGLEVENNLERVNLPERERVFEGGQDMEQAASEVINAIQTEGELGGIQPIGGFASQNTKRQKEIEDIMSQDVRDMYIQMPPDKQQEFKIKGEETAKEINNILDKAKLEVGKIIELLKKWLLIIPGVNKFFIEQEAKIKADEIVRLKNL